MLIIFYYYLHFKEEFIYRIFKNIFFEEYIYIYIRKIFLLSSFVSLFRQIGNFVHDICAVYSHVVIICLSFVYQDRVLLFYSIHS